ncbi:hypothetical protein JCM3765_001793 [Sporobolomyces pararoseus]
MPPRKKVVASTTTDSPASVAVGGGIGTEDDSNGGMGIDQYELPKSVIARLAKSAVPPEVKLQKEVPIALVKSSTVFINYLAALSHDLATEKGTKTITALHVLEATKQLGWEDGGKLLEKELKKELKGFRKIQEKKKNGTYVAPPRGGGGGRGVNTSTTTTSKSKPSEKNVEASGSAGGAGPMTEGEEEEPSEGVTLIRDDDDARPNQGEEEEDLYPEAEEEGIELYSEGEGDQDEEEEEEEPEGFGADGVEEPEGAVDLVELDDVDDED